MKKSTDIENLFSQARSSEPYLSNRYFGKRVLTLLNLHESVSFRKEAAIELLGAFVGCTLAYSFFPFTELINSIPTKFVIGPMTIMSIAGGFSLLGGIGYWAAERSRF